MNAGSLACRYEDEIPCDDGIRHHTRINANLSDAEFIFFLIEA